MSLTDVCPLCGSTSMSLYESDRFRQYFECTCCSLVFVPSKFRLSVEAEKAIYDLHENNPDDVGYRGFLQRAVNPLQDRFKSEAVGLDFGCGPSPVLAAMLADLGYVMHVYDPIYSADNAVFQNKYDFIVSTEVVEHLYNPGDEILRLWSMLKSSGVLVLMTKRVLSKQAFSRWHYKNDPTHVCFFSKPSFIWLASRLGARVEFVSADVAVFTRFGCRKHNALDS